MINGAIARIIVRYGAGALAMYGIMSHEWADMLAGDTDVTMFVEIGVAAAASFTTEAVYAYAKKKGWSP